MSNFMKYLPSSKNPLFVGFCLCGLFSMSVCAAEEEPPTTRVQIINAASVPAISLSINGKIDYPEFGQGLYTGDAPTPRLNPTYKATDLKSALSVEKAFLFEPGKFQSVVLMGDFSTDWPPEKLPQAVEVPEEFVGQEYPPNFQMLVFSHDSEPTKKIRYRIVNAMPRNPMTVKWPSGTADLKPQDFSEVLLDEQNVTFYVKIGETVLEAPVFQRGNPKNVLMIFYLKEGQPAFMRAFENTAEHEKALEQEDSEPETPET